MFRNNMLISKKLEDLRKFIIAKHEAGNEDEIDLAEMVISLNMLLAIPAWINDDPLDRRRFGKIKILCSEMRGPNPISDKMASWLLLHIDADYVYFDAIMGKPDITNAMTSNDEIYIYCIRLVGEFIIRCKEPTILRSLDVILMKNLSRSILSGRIGDPNFHLIPYLRHTIEFYRNDREKLLHFIDVVTEKPLKVSRTVKPSVRSPSNEQLEAYLSQYSHGQLARFAEAYNMNYFRTKHGLIQHLVKLFGADLLGLSIEC